MSLSQPLTSLAARDTRSPLYCITRSKKAMSASYFRAVSSATIPGRSGGLGVQLNPSKPPGCPGGARGRGVSPGSCNHGFHGLARIFMFKLEVVLQIHPTLDQHRLYIGHQLVRKYHFNDSGHRTPPLLCCSWAQCQITSNIPIVCLPINAARNVFPRSALPTYASGKQCRLCRV